MTVDDALLAARAAVVHDLAAHNLDLPDHVDRLDDVLRRRRWWVEQWPDGTPHLLGQVAQDVQEALLEEAGVRWPPCDACERDGAPRDPAHELRVEPDLGPDPHWVCENGAGVVAPLGALARHTSSA